MKKELNLQEIQSVSLEILKDVHQFCVENNIKYSLLDGSMLGAIRHKGFIPWDDDIDIIMPRQDYDRFCSIYKSVSGYKVKYRGNDRHCKVAFARVYDTRKTFMETTVPWCKDQVGVWIDVFPADGALNDENEHQAFYTRNRNLWLKTLILRDPRQFMNDFPKSKRLHLYHLKYLFYVLMSKMGCVDHYVKKMIQRGKAIPFGSTGYWTQIMCMGDNSKEHNRTETFSECSLMPFEDTQVFVMNGFDEVLRGKFNDYMQLPPVEKRVGHGSSYIHFYWK